MKQCTLDMRVNFSPGRRSINHEASQVRLRIHASCILLHGGRGCMSVCFSSACVSWWASQEGESHTQSSIRDNVPLNCAQPIKAPLKTFNGVIGAINQRDRSYGRTKKRKIHIGHMCRLIKYPFLTLLTLFYEFHMTWLF